MKCKLNEQQYKIYKQFLKENQESDSQKKAIELAMKKKNLTKDKATEYIKKTFRMEIQYLNGNSRAGKFTLGAFRLFLSNNSLNDKEIINDCLEKICNDEELYNKYDKNLNGLDLQDLETEVNNKFKGSFKTSNMKRGNYKLVEIHSFEEAHKYSQYTSWCVTHSINMFNTYTSNGKFQFKFLLREGFDKVEKVSGKNTPLDEYGLSMIAICVGFRGKIKTCTCRWNHDNGGNDHIMNASDITALVGEDMANKIFVEPESLAFYSNIANKVQNIIIKDDPIEELFKVCDCRVTEMSKKHQVFEMRFYDDDVRPLCVKVVKNRFKIVNDDYYSSISTDGKYIFFMYTDEEYMGELYNIETDEVVHKDVVLECIRERAIILARGTTNGNEYIVLDIIEDKQKDYNLDFEHIKNAERIYGSSNDFLSIEYKNNDKIDIYLLNCKTFEIVNDLKPIDSYELDDYRNVASKGHYISIQSYNQKTEQIKIKFMDYRDFSKVYEIVCEDYAYQTNTIEDTLKCKYVAIDFGKYISIRNTYEDISKELFRFSNNGFDVLYIFKNYIQTKIIDNFSNEPEKVINLVNNKTIYDSNFNKLMDDIDGLYYNYTINHLINFGKLIIDNSDVKIGNKKFFDVNRFLTYIIKDNELYCIDPDLKIIKLKATFR